MVSRALLISPDPNTVSVLSQVLAEMELATEECFDFASAPQKISDHSYEVILVDCAEQAGSDALTRHIRSSKVNER